MNQCKPLILGIIAASLMFGAALAAAGDKGQPLAGGLFRTSTPPTLNLLLLLLRGGSLRTSTAPTLYVLLLLRIRYMSVCAFTMQVSLARSSNPRWSDCAG